MMCRARLLAAWLALLAAAGCATPPPEPEPEPEPKTAEVVEPVRAKEPPPPAPPPPVVVIAPAPDEASLALSYFDRARRMPPAELAREVDAIRAIYGRTHSDADRLRLAMLLGLPNTAVTDDARALELLEPLVKTPTHALHPVAVLLSTYVQEQRRLAQNAQASQKEVQTLQQKLDALRSLERALSEREGAAPRRR